MKASKVLGTFGVCLLFILYPLLSFNWFRFCRKNGDGDAKKFLVFGILGVMGIALEAVGIFISLVRTSSPTGIEFLISTMPTIFGGLMYLVAGILQTNLLIWKRYGKRRSFLKDLSLCG